MPYLGRVPTGVGSLTEFDGDLKITGQLTSNETLFKMIMDASDGSATDDGDNILIEAGGTDGSGTNAEDDICLEQEQKIPFNQGGGNEGRTIEEFAMVCDGGSVTVGSGTYTSVSVIAEQVFTTTYADLTGSNITYTPPVGATSVIYQFEWLCGRKDVSALLHQKLYIAGAEVIYARTTHSSQSGTPETVISSTWAFKIGQGDNANTGRVQTWTTAKEIKMTIRNYSTDYEGSAHMNAYWDGSATDVFRMPVIRIIAIA